MKKIVVLGGGTAGWLTALLTREFHPGFEITVVESESIGILGAGEGTVPHFISVLDFLKIPVSALVRECSATLKIGIKFSNWHGDGSAYFHNFIANDELEMWSLDNIFRFDVLPALLIANGTPLDSASFVSRLANANKVPFIQADLKNHDLRNYADPIHSLHHLGNFALHFDARLLAAFLGKLAQQQRNIRRVEGKLQEVQTDAAGNITALKLESGQSVPCDFVFDCSGFARLLLGKHFGETWTDYSKHLPLDAALPFFLPHDGSTIPPYTEAIAMKYGWMWKIPVQDRYGCGYVFDSSYINETEAQQEVEEMLGFPVTSPNAFRFQAGAFHNSLVKNCFAVGLSQNFVEPLEATSIWVFTKNLVNFLKADALNNLNPEVTARINASCRRVNDPIPEFLQLHYLTRRNDSEFWRSFRTRMQLMPALIEKLAFWQQMPVLDHDSIQLDMFKAPSWLLVGAGVEQLNRDAFSRLAGDFSYGQRLQQAHQSLLQKQAHYARACMLHTDVLALLRTAL
jgi:tryptophan halogenase